MSELLHFPEKDKALIEAADALGFEALSIVTDRFGTGNLADITPEVKDLAYHNMEHTLDVRKNSRKMAEALGLNALDTAIVVLAASAHDIVQVKERGVMEKESAEWLAEKMLHSGFSHEDIEAAALAILGTEPVVSQDGLILGQRMELTEFPSQRALDIAVCVACGDMGNLYAPSNALSGLNLYKEMQGFASDDTPGLDNMLAFQRVQLRLMQSYQFPHPAAKALFEEFREDAINHQMWITQQLHLGIIDSWDELVRQNAEFAKAYEY